MTNPPPLQFELTTLGGADIAARYFPPDSATYRTLFETGVPRTFLEWIITADPHVSVFQADGIGPLLRFATFGRHYLVVNPADEKVVLIIDPDWGKLRVQRFVNSSLPLFVETARLLTERFPYEYWDDESKSEWYAEEDLEQLIISVEPLAYSDRVDGVEPFWSVFVSDLGLGAYSQEAILGIEWERPDHDTTP